MARSLKKGPHIDGHLMKKIEDLNKKNDKKVIRYMVAPFDDFAGDGGTHHCGAQRQKVYSRVHHGKHGGTQAGRVLLYAAVQRALDEGSGGNCGQTGGRSRRSGCDCSGGSGSRLTATHSETESSCGEMR